ncbi:MAG: MFS transporter, partial [bacterium]
MLTRWRTILFLSVLHGLIHGSMNIFPVIMQGVARQFGWSLTQVSAVGTVGYVLFGVMALPSGWFADADRRTGLITILIGFLIGTSAIQFSATWWIFITGWLFLCLSAGLYHPIGLSSVSITYPDQTGSAMGWHGFGGNKGFAITPFVAGILADFWGWEAAFLAALVPALLLLIWVGFSRVYPQDEGPPKINEGHSVDWSKSLFVVLVVYGLIGFIYRGAVTFIPISFQMQWSSGFSFGAIGGLASLVYACGGLGQLLGGQLEEQFPSR